MSSVLLKKREYPKPVKVEPKARTFACGFPECGDSHVSRKDALNCARYKASVAEMVKFQAKCDEALAAKAKANEDLESVKDELKATKEKLEVANNDLDKANSELASVLDKAEAAEKECAEKLAENNKKLADVLENAEKLVATHVQPVELGERPTE
jgi:septal ring factor EnvC (AmiA/AmiB activator)